jgi:hypothetical protein
LEISYFEIKQRKWYGRSFGRHLEQNKLLRAKLFGMHQYDSKFKYKDRYEAIGASYDKFKTRVI